MKCTECGTDFVPDCDQEEICPKCQAEDVAEATMDYPDPECCPVCGNEMQWEQCWDCQGAGGFHNCG